MKPRIKLSLFLLSLSMTAFCQVPTITNTGSSFSPANITIIHGESVNFNLSSEHNAVEVSEATWNANGSTILSGGFQAPFGGGLVDASQLNVGTHYYVCAPHAFLGMKGIIIVQAATSISERGADSQLLTITPNPSNGKFQMSLNTPSEQNNIQIEIYNITGQVVHQSSLLKPSHEIDLTGKADGIYIVKVLSENKLYTEKIVVNHLE